MSDGFLRTRAANCPRCRHLIVIEDKTVTETDCPNCGLHVQVQFDPNQEQIFPIGGGLFITMNLN